MATQDERLATVEKGFATFQRETVLKIQETNENAAMLLGLAYKQNIETKHIHERLDAMDNRLGTIDNRLDSIERRMETKFDEHTKRFDRVENLLAQILERLPK